MTLRSRVESAADGILGSCTEIVVQGTNVRGTEIQGISKLSECIGVQSKMGLNASEQGEGHTYDIGVGALQDFYRICSYRLAYLQDMWLWGVCGGRGIRWSGSATSCIYRGSIELLD